MHDQMREIKKKITVFKPNYMYVILKLVLKIKMGNHKYNLLKSFKRCFKLKNVKRQIHTCITESVKLCNYEINWRCINKY